MSSPPLNTRLLPFVTMAAIMGGNVRVGMEDSIYLEKGVKAKTSAEQVNRKDTQGSSKSFPLKSRPLTRLERCLT